jgi:hypothetical protein
MPERHFHIALQHEFRKCEMRCRIAIHATDGTENLSGRRLTVAA